VLVDGRIVKSGGRTLALDLEAKGYDWVKADAAMAQRTSA
jgi:Fe-S cluster assembly ATP-binding protein